MDKDRKCNAKMSKSKVQMNVKKHFRTISTILDIVLTFGSFEIWNLELFRIWHLKLAFYHDLLYLYSDHFTRVGCQRSKAGITVAGSTSVEPFAELLAEEYMSRHPESHIYVQGGGSTAGIEAVRTRAANIGMSSRSLLPNEKNLYAVTIAKDAIAIIVHPKNPIQDLSWIRSGRSSPER